MSDLEARRTILREVVEKLVDGSHNPPPKQEQGMPMLSARNIENGRIVFDEFRYISKAAFEQESARTRVLPGDVLLTIVGTIGRAAVVPHGASQFSLQRSVAVLTPKPILLSKYLCYQLQATDVQRYFDENARGTAQKGVYLKTLGATPILVPPVSEQAAVVAEIEKQFSRLDEAVANLQRVKANLKRYKAAVLKAAVEGRLVETEASLAHREGRAFETGEQLLQRLVEVRKSPVKGKRANFAVADDTDQLVCPDGWAWSNCDAAIQTIDAGASFKCEERPPAGEEFGVLKVSALTWGVYDESESKTCKDAARNEEKFLVRDGDFLFSRANTIELVGACVIVGKTTKRLMLSDKTLRFTVSAGVLPAWLQICLRCKFGRDEIERLATGNQESMRNIGQERIRQIRMPFPPLAEQARIVAEVDRRLSILSGVESEVDANLKRAQALRQSVLSKLYS